MDVAVKVIARDKIGHPKLQENLLTEISILRDYNHINIVRLYDHFNSNKYIFLVLEFCEGGDLSKYIKKYKNVSACGVGEEISIKFLKQIASGLLFLSQKSLIHRDLKPANILMTECSEYAILKLADFGFAKELKDADKMTQTRCGTPLYMSPEILECLEYNSKVDIWSCGCIFYEMIVGVPPFKGNNEVDLLKNIKTRDLSLPPHVILSKESIMLMKGLLEKDPIRRISLERFNQVLDKSSEDRVTTSTDLVCDFNLTTDIKGNDVDTKQRASDIKINSATNTLKGGSISTREDSIKVSSLPLTRRSSKDLDSNAHETVTHRRYSSDESDTLHSLKNKQKSNWLPVSSFGANLGKAIVSFAQPSYKIRSRSSSADTACDGFGRTKGKYSMNKNSMNSEDDFIIIDTPPSASRFVQHKEDVLDGSKVLSHLQKVNEICDIKNMLSMIADNMIKEVISQESSQKELDLVEISGKKSNSIDIQFKRIRGESVDIQNLNNYSSACSLYLHVLSLLHGLILNNKTILNSLGQDLMIYQQPLQEISRTMLNDIEIVVLRVEQCCDRLSLVSTPCNFPKPELIMYHSAIKLAQQASIEELLGNLERAQNKYFNAQALINLILVKVQNNNDKRKLTNCLSLISNHYEICKELILLSKKG